jgi:decaprenylphospho-beta-D-ribofuranose 2-oxidase
MKKSVANWGNYPVTETDEQLFNHRSALSDFTGNGQTLVARGNGRCYGDASLAAVTCSMLSYNKMLEFDKTNGVFNCQAGLTLDHILDVIVPAGWFLPVTPGTKFITVGGAVASDVHGKNHHTDGAFSQHITDMDVLTGLGETITCSPEENKDLFQSTCGGMGLTGIITRVKFRLKKIETSFIRQKQLKAKNLDHILQLFEENNHYTYSVAWIDCLKKGKNFGRSILILGEHALTGELTPKQQKDPLALPKKKKFNFPFNLPSFFLNAFTVRSFNFLYYHKNLKPEINNIVSYEPFFYPLDAVLNWNRGYGKKGFVQYQFVLPLESKEGLADILHRISEKGMGSFLAVLKVFGPQDDLISFPMKGYTLALDFPVRKNLFAFLDELDQVVLRYKGRIYLSKDARMNAGVFTGGYARSGEFIQTVKKYNPDFVFRSVQSDRLGITTTQ